MIIKERLADIVLDVPFLKWLACGQVVRIFILMCRRALKIVIMRSFYFNQFEPNNPHSNGSSSLGENIKKRLETLYVYAPRKHSC